MDGGKCDGETTTVKLNIKIQQREKEILSCSVNFSYDIEEVPSGRFISAIKYGKSKGMGVKAGYYVNAYHMCWGSPDINSSGSRLLEYLLGTKQQIPNLGKIHPTFFNVVTHSLPTSQ